MTYRKPQSLNPSNQTTYNTPQGKLKIPT